MCLCSGETKHLFKNEKFKISKSNAIKETLSRAAIIRWHSCVWSDLPSVSYSAPRKPSQKKNQTSTSSIFHLDSGSRTQPSSRRRERLPGPQKVAAARSCADRGHMSLLTHLDIFSPELNWAEWGLETGSRAGQNLQVTVHSFAGSRRCSSIFFFHIWGLTAHCLDGWVKDPFKRLMNITFTLRKVSWGYLMHKNQFCLAHSEGSSVVWLSLQMFVKSAEMWKMCRNVPKQKLRQNSKLLPLWK